MTFGLLAGVDGELDAAAFIADSFYLPDGASAGVRSYPDLPGHVLMALSVPEFDYNPDVARVTVEHAQGFPVVQWDLPAGTQGAAIYLVTAP